MKQYTLPGDAPDVRKADKAIQDAKRALVTHERELEELEAAGVDYGQQLARADALHALGDASKADVLEAAGAEKQAEEAIKAKRREIARDKEIVRILGSKRASVLGAAIKDLQAEVRADHAETAARFLAAFEQAAEALNELVAIEALFRNSNAYAGDPPPATLSVAEAQLGVNTSAGRQIYTLQSLLAEKPAFRTLRAKKAA